MIYSYPMYYNKFKCVANKCIDTCCSAWQIVVDEDSLEYYKKYQGEFKNTLYNNIDFNEGVFKHRQGGKCAFLQDDLLCSIYINMGKDSLCTTCREFPRHTEEFENVREISLSLSCPEVAKMLILLTDKVSFDIIEDDEEEVYEEFDYFLFSYLEDIREAMIEIIQNREVNLKDRIENVLMIGASAQRHLEEGDLVLWDEYEECDKVKIINEYELSKKHMRFLSEELELLYDDWDNILTESVGLLFGRGEKDFIEKKQTFVKWLKESDLPQIDIVLEQILVYFISIYLPGAVYDDNIKGKVDSSAAHVSNIFYLLLARWIKNDKSLCLDDMIEIVYRYSREIEHSDENLNIVEELEWF